MLLKPYYLPGPPGGGWHRPAPGSSHAARARTSPVPARSPVYPTHVHRRRGSPRGDTRETVYFSRVHEIWSLRQKASHEFYDDVYSDMRIIVKFMRV